MPLLYSMSSDPPCHPRRIPLAPSTLPTPIHCPKQPGANRLFSGCIRWVAFISGLAVVSLPNSTETATIHGGRNGLILATDTKNVSTLGHITMYPSKKDTVGIQIPTSDNEIPGHTVLHVGPCKTGEMDQ